MILCSAMLAAFSLNGCTGVTSARGAKTTAAPTAAPTAAAPAAVPAAAPTGPGTIWFVRNDGGSRYDATNNPSGQCNGKADASYPGSGTNRSCAFNDVRYLWSDGSAAGSWVLAGGDTAFIRGGPWRTGAPDGVGGKFNNFGCFGGVPQYCGNLDVPAGTSGQHTRFLGENYANCSSPSAKTQTFGGFGQGNTWNLENTSFVDMECLEITDHGSCVIISGASNQCHNSTPYDDYALNGILLCHNSSFVSYTHDLLLQDLNIHGLVDTGLAGCFGANITLNRVRVAFNTFAGWDMDNSSDLQNATNASLDNEYVTMEWNGCSEEYPIVDSVPARACYDQNSGGFGDAWSGQDASVASIICNHCITRYNTKDGWIGPHTYAASTTIKNSIWYGNEGVAIKAGAQTNGSYLLQNNLIISNCDRLQAAFPGAPSGYNANLKTPCRADGTTLQLNWPVNGSVEFDNNSFVMASSKTGMDIGCTIGVSAVSVNSGGTGYQVGDVVYFNGSPQLEATFTVTSVSSGVVTGLSLTTAGSFSTCGPGSAYCPGPNTNNPTSGGHGTGLTTNNSFAGNTCNGGKRIMRNNIFLGYVDPNNPAVAGQSMTFVCYTACLSNPADGTTNDTMWTTRTNNSFYGFNTSSGGGNCTYGGELCNSDPLFVNEPPQTWTSESQLDNFNFHLSASSPAIGAGVVITGLTTDYAGTMRLNPPSIGAYEYMH